MRNRDLRPAAKANPTIQQAFERFQKYNRHKNLSQGLLDFYAAKGRSFFRFLGDTEQPIHTITEETVEDYIFYMKDQQLHDTTINTNLRMVRAFLSCVSEIRFYYRDAERKALLDSIPPDEKVVVFVTSHAALEKMKLIYGDAASYYCSDHNKSGAMDTLYDCVRHGKLLKRILFTTTVFYNGVDIKDETVKHIFIEQWLPMNKRFFR